MGTTGESSSRLTLTGLRLVLFSLSLIAVTAFSVTVVRTNCLFSTCTFGPTATTSALAPAQSSRSHASKRVSQQPAQPRAHAVRRPQTKQTTAAHPTTSPRAAAARPSRATAAVPGEGRKDDSCTCSSYAFTDAGPPASSTPAVEPAPDDPTWADDPSLDDPALDAPPLDDPSLDPAPDPAPTPDTTGLAPPVAPSPDMTVNTSSATVSVSATNCSVVTVNGVTTKTGTC